ncbi:MAG: ATP synthase F0 subunit B, partial [bacterium]
MSIEMKTIATMVIAFALFIWTMSKVAVKPFLGLLDERGNTIRKTFDELASQKAELTRLKNEADARLAQLESEATERKAQALAEAHRIAAELQAEARVKYAEMLEKGRADLAIE